jgi:hypothetical protein
VIDLKLVIKERVSSFGAKPYVQSRYPLNSSLKRKVQAVAEATTYERIRRNCTVESATRAQSNTGMALANQGLMTSTNLEMSL